MVTGPLKALITGITGQDGSYLAELLLNNGYEVHGIIRRASNFNTQKIDHLYKDPHDPDARLFLHYGDLADAESIRKLMYTIQPDELYNLGAQSHVRVSFDIPEYTANIVAIGTLRILETIRDYEDHTARRVKFYQASSSEMFGSAPPPQSEETPFQPQSPYGAAKVFAYHITRMYREAYGLFAVNGILFNHESPRRGETFVTRKISRAAARIALGLQETLFLGNLEAKRDWGSAQDYVRAMHAMLQRHIPDDFIVATGKTHSVREFCERAFAEVGISLSWRGKGIRETGREKKTRRTLVRIDSRYYRPAEVVTLRGDAAKARRVLGWKPSVTFEDLIRSMVHHDFELARGEATQRRVPLSSLPVIRLHD